MTPAGSRPWPSWQARPEKAAHRQTVSQSLAWCWNDIEVLSHLGHISIHCVQRVEKWSLWDKIRLIKNEFKIILESEGALWVAIPGKANRPDWGWSLE
jgi:hypothetical protein